MFSLKQILNKLGWFKCYHCGKIYRKEEINSVVWADDVDEDGRGTGPTVLVCDGCYDYLVGLL